MIAPFYNRYRTAWPFAVPDTLETSFDTIDTSVEHPPWHVPGHWKTPPPQVCNLLTAENFELKFTFDSELFNAEYGTIMPSIGSSSFYGNSGAWLTDYYFIRTSFNEDNKWDTRRKVFERFIDITEPHPFLDYGLKGFRYVNGADVFYEEADLERRYDLELTMLAQIPYPAKDQNGEFIWTVNNILQAQVREVIYRFADGTVPPSPTTIIWPLNVGSRYLGIDHLGPQGHGAGGCMPVAEISILSHFTP
jgi:hypothetical protein